MKINKQIDQHTKKYIHIPQPSLIGIGKFLLTIFLGFLSYFNFKLILKIWNDYNLGYVFASDKEINNFTPKFIDLIVLYPIVGEFLLISLTIICLISLFKKLKNYNENGLIFELIFGLTSGLIGGLIFGLISGLIIGLTSGLIIGLSEEFN